MYALKMEDGKELITTVRGTIYQNERNADTLVFLLPRTYEGTDMADCSLLMQRKLKWTQFHMMRITIVIV